MADSIVDLRPDAEHLVDQAASFFRTFSEIDARIGTMPSPLGRRSWSRSLRLARMTGAVAEPHYGGVPPHVAAIALARLDDRLRAVVGRLCERHRFRI
jgi:hypothetical protein